MNDFPDKNLCIEDNCNAGHSHSAPVLVLGAGRNTGLYIARRMAEQGKRLFISFRSDPEAAVKLQLEYPQNIIGAWPIEASVASGVKSFFDKVRQKTDRLYAVINCIGPFQQSSLMDTDEETFLDILNGNLAQAFFVAKQSWPLLKKNGRGRLIHFSMAGIEKLSAYRCVAAHASAKTGLLSLTRSLALEWQGDGISVNAIAPGRIAREKDVSASAKENAGAPFVNDADIFNAVEFLLSEKSDGISGTNLVVSKGWGW